MRNALTEDLTPSSATLRQQAYWRTTRRWTAALMLMWLGATLAMVYWPLAWDFDFGGWPFGFWLAAQGVLLLYWLIVAVYARAMGLADGRWAQSAASEERL